MTRQLSLPGDGIRLGRRICSKNIPPTSLLNWHRWLPGVSSFDGRRRRVGVVSLVRLYVPPAHTDFVEGVFY